VELDSAVTHTAVDATSPQDQCHDTSSATWTHPATAIQLPGSASEPPQQGWLPLPSCGRRGAAEASDGGMCESASGG